MKQLRSNRLGLLCLSFLLCLGVGIGVKGLNDEAARTRAATSVTVNFGSASGSINVNSESITGTDSAGTNWTITTVMTTSSFTPNSSYNQIGASTKPATSITLEGKFKDGKTYNVTNFSTKWGGFSGTAGTIVAKVGATQIASGSLNAGNDVTISQSSSSSASDDNLTISVTGISKGVKLYSLSYSYEEVATKTLTGITLNDNRTDDQKVYTDGDSFSTKGITITANYSDADDEDVTNSVAWNKTTLATGDTEVIGTYKDKTVSVPITVNAYAYEGDGTLENPYSIDDAVRLANLGGKEGVFVKGTGKPAWYSSSKTFSVYFPNKDDAKFTFYTMYADENNTPFSKQSVLGESANTEVLAYGNIILYGTTAELDAGCYIYDYKATSISASTPTTSGLKAGDVITKLDQLGVSVTANIEVTGEQRDVTSEATIDATTLVKGTNTITVRYTQTNKYSGKTTNNTELTTTITLNDIPQKATKVEITSSVSEVNIGETITLTAKVSPDDTTNPTITWSSDDEDIATVDSSSGVVTGVKAGEVIIIATCDDVSDMVVIEVKDPTNVLELLEVSGTCQDEYFVGETFDPTGLTVKGKYSDGVTIIDVTDEVTWPSSPFTTADEATIISVSYTYVENGVTKTLTNDEAAIVSVVEKVLSSISVSGQKTEYTIADTTIDTSSMVVTASYENTTRTFDVSESDSIKVTYDIDFSKLGNKEVNVSYTEDGVTKSTSYNVNVSVGDLTVKVKTQGTAGYKKVTADKTDWSGTYLIVYESDTSKYVFSGVDASNGYFTPTIKDGVIINPDVTVTIEKVTGGYSIKINGGTKDGNYLNYSTDNNGLAFSKDSKETQTISYDSTGQECLIKNSKGAVIRFNNTSGQMRFRYYKSNSYTSQQAICLYEYFDGVTLVDHTVSGDLYTAVQEANAALVCGSSSTGVWVDGNYNEATAKEYLEMLETADLELLKTAEANKDGNLVENFLWKYDYLVSTNKITNFLNRNVSTSSSNAIYKFNSNNNQIILISAIISCLGIATLGGALLSKKRKRIININ